MPSVYTDRFGDGIISVSIYYRRKNSVSNSVAFLRFSGSVFIVLDVVRILNGRTILYNLISNYCKNKIKITRIKIDIDKNY